jgi:hypothetical protein
MAVRNGIAARNGVAAGNGAWSKMQFALMGFAF